MNRPSEISNLEERGRPWRGPRAPRSTSGRRRPGRCPGVAALLAGALLAAALPVPATAAESAVRRFALLVGANDGGAGRSLLRYAGTDAVAMGKVLVELGGVAPDDRVFLLDPDRRLLETTLASLGSRLREARVGGRVELIFYYSGHSDEEGLLLGGERFRYAELRRHLEEAPADVRVAILDSCASGALTRGKGGIRRPPFLVDASAQVQGHAFLTSASAHEAAQESDRLQASFFTHALLTGLRGAADLGRDGRVTLNEAYHFAFQETLARTERTLRGAQHPNFDIQMVGTGDLVITDLRGTAAGLLVREEVAGRIYVRDGEGTLVAELAKPAGRTVELGLDPGPYRVTVDAGGRLAEARLVLVEGGRTELGAGALAPVTGEATVARGDGPDPGARGPYREVPVDVTLFPGSSLARALAGGAAAEGERHVRKAALNLTVGRSARLAGAQVSLLGSLVEEGASWLELAGFGSAVGDRMEGVQVSGMGNLAGELAGFQAAGAVNVAGGVEGLQLAGAANVARGVEGLQLAGAANVARGVAGLQLAGAANVAGDVEGLQLAVVNVGGNVSGLQLGVVNVATGTVDAQVGVLNVAGDATAPVGLLSLSREGIHHLELWANETTPVNLAARLGGRRIYGILTGGVRDGDASRLVAGLGLGVHFPAPGKLSVDLDALGQHVWDPDGTLATGGGNTLGTLRLGVGYDLGPVSVIGGPTYNVLATYGTDPGERVPPGVVLPGTPAGAREWQAGSVRARGWPGFFLGAQL